MIDRLTAIRRYHEALGRASDAVHYAAIERELALTDLFFLLVYVLGRVDLNRDWYFARCREVQAAPNGYLDLWAREHGKSSIITFGLTIKDILNDPEITIGIFSFNRPIAKAFLRQIKREFEANEKLKGLFPDVLWSDPQRQSPKWSEDDGIIVKRAGNPKESTIEAYGLVDGQPTSRHYRLIIYDDIVTKDSVGTPEMIQKVTEYWEASLNLSTEGGVFRFAGTRWHHNDTYRVIIERRAALPRIYKVTDDGTWEGEPVLWSRSVLTKKRRDMGVHTASAQLMLDPTADHKRGFLEVWINYYEDRGSGFGNCNKYILVDAASEKKKTSDYTAMIVIGLGPDENYYWIDGIRDRLGLRERGDALFSLHRRWRPMAVGYEKYGLMSDIEYMRERMIDENYRFEITELGGQMSKPDRIRRLSPAYEAGRWYLPHGLIKVDYEGRHVDLVTSFIMDEYLPFPLGLHDDMFDAMSRIMDEKLGAIWPRAAVVEDRYARPPARRRRYSAWAA